MEMFCLLRGSSTHTSLKAPHGARLFLLYLKERFANLALNWHILLDEKSIIIVASLPDKIRRWHKW